MSERQTLCNRQGLPSFCNQNEWFSKVKENNILEEGDHWEKEKWSSKSESRKVYNESTSRVNWSKFYYSKYWSKLF